MFSNLMYRLNLLILNRGNSVCLERINNKLFICILILFSFASVCTTDATLTAVPQYSPFGNLPLEF